MKYEKYFSQIVWNTPISGIRHVNFWESKIPQSNQICMNIGQPDLPTPEYVKNAVKKAVQQNLTRYTNLLGEIELRRAIADYQSTKFSLNYSPDEILVTAGGQSAIFAVLQSILSPKDNVIVPMPSYPPYINAIKYNRANIIPLSTSVESNFDISMEDLKKIITEYKIKCLLLISPSNPTGKILPLSTLREIAKLAEENDFLIISDEIYNSIIFNSTNYASIATLQTARNRTIIIQSFSKMLSMCGFRIGYILAPQPFIEQVKVVHHTMNICANSMAQFAALEALMDQQLLQKSISDLVKTFQNRRDLCMEILSREPSILTHEPDGAFYLFPKISNIDTHKFCKWLKWQYGVLTVPGVFFYNESVEEARNYLRICFTSSAQELEKGCTLILKGLEEFS